MKICALTAEEAARLEHYALWPSCKMHKHISTTEAQSLIEADLYRFVGGRDTKVGETSMIVPCSTNERTWANRPSGHPLGFVVKQYVPV